MLRKTIIKKYIHTHDIDHVIWHNSSIFIKWMLKTILLLFVIYIIYLALNQRITFEHLDRVFGGLWVLILIKYCVDFLNLYLDWLALTSDGVTLFLWEWILTYKTEYFQREKIEAISHTQDSLWDKIFNKWDIIISLEHGIEFPFENITSPQKQVQNILRLRDVNSIPSSNNESESLPDDKISILAEALSEVVKDYVTKKSNTNVDNEIEDLLRDNYDITQDTNNEDEEDYPKDIYV